MQGSIKYCLSSISRVRLPGLYCVILFLAHMQFAMAVDCETDNAALQAMSKTMILFTFADGKQLELKARLADNPKTRAAGFQRVCASTIADTPILFLFERPVKPSFHMRNVVAPLDIAFIQRNGKIDSIHAMDTYVLGSRSRPLYSPGRPVIAALEVSPGFYTDSKIDKTVTVSWRAATDRF